ncbi:hypothetical protein PVK06_032398 [Gossypium arboreum]|uniref:Uncharacterized protein n=1 Tax=Gossypium arboreum TaxID=29729 RepID=A0ABR0NTQ2_GOSAR|nr:hypothetical protein PVK06_032398 [Gossypium arboreum]
MPLLRSNSPLSCEHRPSFNKIGIGANKNPAKNTTGSSHVENKLENYRKGPNSSGGLHLNATSHYNPTFEGPSKMELTLKSNVLYLTKHSTVIFMDHIGINNNDSLEVSNSTNSESSISISKLHGTVEKDTIIRKDWVLNKTIKDRGGHFKTVKNTKVSLPDSMNSMVDTEPNKVVGVPNSKHWSTRIASKQ